MLLVVLVDGVGLGLIHYPKSCDDLAITLS